MINRLQALLGNQSGMSLAEILVASVIIAIGLVGLLSAVPLASYGIQEGRNLSTATFLANQRLEEVRNAAWTQNPAADKLGASASATVAPVAAGIGVTFPDEPPMAAPYAGYTRTVRVLDCGVAPGCNAIVNAGMRQVIVEVSYTPITGIGQAAAGSTKAATVSMIISQR
jgi:prepilin-type N-terminal cleavage/methylation domain-containing protein